MTTSTPDLNALHSLTSEELVSRLNTLAGAIRVAAGQYQDRSMGWLVDKFDAINTELGRRGL